jgi:hypothetical protein
MDSLAYDARRTVYGDTVVTTVSKDGDTLTLKVFDLNGVLKHRTTAHKDWANFSSIWPDFFPTGKVAAALSYGAEVLYPPVLHGLSVVGLPQSTPLESHRSLLTMPLGVPARRARLAHAHPADGVFSVFLSLIPMVALSLFLATRVDRDARRAGMAEARRGIWTSATVLLGLVAYITYRLTRPRTDLVTCTNCGKLRRTDHDRCQNCDAAWQMPELTAPSWRVLDLPD